VRFMSLLDLILSRRSIRRYETKNIPEEVLHQILEAGRLPLQLIGSLFVSSLSRIMIY
jgi:nitroreductase